jgi:hypothetical protein
MNKSTTRGYFRTRRRLLSGCAVVALSSMVAGLAFPPSAPQEAKSLQEATPRVIRDFGGRGLPHGFELPVPRGAELLMIRHETPRFEARAEYTFVLAVPSLPETIAFYDGAFRERGERTLLVLGSGRDVGGRYGPTGLTEGDVLRFGMSIKGEGNPDVLIYVRRLEDAEKRLGGPLNTWLELRSTHPFVAEVVVTWLNP